MIKVYCLDIGDAQMYAAAEDIREATDLMLDTYDLDMVKEGFSVKPLSKEELNAEIVDENGVKSSWRLIIDSLPGWELPCIIGERC